MSDTIEMLESGDRGKWLALATLGLGALMVAVDGVIVNVALPAIGSDLRLSETSLTWAVNAYLVAFGGFLLLGGRLGDLIGQRRIFLAGILIFSATSLLCGLAGSSYALIGARFVQGLGGAAICAVSLSLALQLFTEQRERVRAISVFGFISTAGGTVALMCGGVLTSTLGWHWIFLVNVPIGAAVYVLGAVLIRPDQKSFRWKDLDVAGAVALTTSLVIFLYSILERGESGGVMTKTSALMLVAILLILVFPYIETQARFPLIPPGLFQAKAFAMANLINAMVSGSITAWYFVGTLYLQRVLGYTSLEVGVAFIPAGQVVGALSLIVSPWVVGRIGVERSLTFGLCIISVGFVVFASGPVGNSYLLLLLIGGLLTTVGLGVVSTPLLLTVTGRISRDSSGLASGIVATAASIGGALGLSILVRIASWRARQLEVRGVESVLAIHAGYHTALLGCAVVTFVAAALSAGIPPINAAATE